MIYKVVYSDAALNDIDEIYEYIAYELLVPRIAENQINRIVEAIALLENLPYRYKVYGKEPCLSQGIRSFTVGKYIVFYYPIEKDAIVRVIRIIYAGRDIGAELSR